MSFDRQDLVNFLSALDSELTKRFELIIIGGASLTLAYDYSNTTVDMDLLSRITAELTEAIEKAKLKTHIDIKVSTTRVYAEIMNMESRMQTLDELQKLKHLIIYVPEKHDLALMKCARSELKDIQDIEGLHRKDKLDPQILLKRFKNEVLPLNAGSDKLAKSNFLDMIENLFGEELAEEFTEKIK